jgi:hypothetical protein
VSSVRATFRPRTGGVREAGRSESIYRELERRAGRVKNVARGFAAPHYKTGEYDRSFETERVRIRGMAAVRLINTAGHALALERGTPPHVIEPSTKKALAWPGGRHPVKRVNHPGTEALHIMRNALRAAGNG